MFGSVDASDPSAKAAGAYDAARRAAWFATCVAGVCVTLVGACVTSVMWRVGDAETRSEDASGETLNVGYVVAGTALVLTLAALAHVALEYRKIVELLDLVEACTTDPAKIRGAVEEQVASRGGGCFGDVENYLFAGPVANILAAPPPAVVAAVENAAVENAAAPAVHHNPSQAHPEVAGSILAGVARASGAAPALAAADATAKTLDAVAALDIPDDPEAVIAAYVEAALMRIPDEILASVHRNAMIGPVVMILVGAAMMLAGGGAGGSGGGVAFELVGGVLLACGVMGAVAAQVTFCATRAVVHAALRSLVQTQAAAMRGGGNALAAAGKRAGEAWTAGKAAVSDGVRAAGDGLAALGAKVSSYAASYGATEAYDACAAHAAASGKRVER